MRGVMKLVVNADDFGCSVTANNATIQLIEKGLISSATILANGAAVEHALEYAREHQKVSFGVHLNIADGTPLLKATSETPLVSNDGRFRYRSPVSRIKLSWRSAIYDEWSAQIRFLLSRGIAISHMDSECHVHTHPVLADVLNKLRNEFGISVLRNTKNIYASNQHLGVAKSCYKSAWSRYQRYVSGFKMTDGFADLASFVECFEQVRRRYASVEAMVHPGQPYYESETRILQSVGYQALVAQCKVVSYSHVFDFDMMDLVSEP
jgi:predicted glycoside hydrolase/deacetylase ChbG (UPF0249 family)